MLVNKFLSLVSFHAGLAVYDTETGLTEKIVASKTAQGGVIVAHETPR